MAYLNIIYFLIITLVGFKYLRSDGKVVKGGFNPAVAYHYSGVELFWCLTYATGLLAFSLEMGLNLMAIRLLVLEILCVMGLSMARYKPVWSLPLKIYVAYLLWICIGAFYGPSMFIGIRVILKYMYPILLCLFASAAVRDSEVFMKSSLLARAVAAVSIPFFLIPFLNMFVPGVFWYGTASAINYISLMIFSVGMFFFSNQKRKNLLYTLLFLAPCFIAVFRTSIMGSGVAIAAFCLIKYKIKAVPYIAAVLLVGAVSVFYVEPIKEKMFYDTNVTLQDYLDGKIDENNFNTNKRSTMWKKLQKKFYEEHEVIGSGTGSVQTYMYANRSEFGGLTVPHSDFVQQKCDNGLIGLILYGAIVFTAFFDCAVTYWRNRNGVIRLCAIVAGASMLGVYATLYSDNVVNYSMATLSMPFGFYGMMLGMRRQQQLGG